MRVAAQFAAALAEHGLLQISLPRSLRKLRYRPSFPISTPVIPAKAGIQRVEAKLAIRNQV